MKDKKISASVSMEMSVIDAATKYATTQDRNFSWYVNDIVKKDLIAKGLITEPLNIE